MIEPTKYERRGEMTAALVSCEPCEAMFWEVYFRGLDNVTEHVETFLSRSSAVDCAVDFSNRYPAVARAEPLFMGA